MIRYETGWANVGSQNAGRDPADGGSAGVGRRAAERSDRLLRICSSSDLSVAATSAGQRARPACVALAQRHRSAAPPHAQAGAATLPLDQREGPSPAWF